MSFSSLKFYNFRNLNDIEIKFSGKNIYLIGENGQGKTNFLEAVYLLCIGSSFRVKNESYLIKNGFSEMSVKGLYNNKDNSNNLQIKYQKGKKSIFVDNYRLTDRKQLLRDYPCIAFTHEDINYVNGPPAYRRQFINQTISLYDFAYIDSLRAYNRILKLRNRVLKERKTGLLDIYDSQLADAGIHIQQKREKLLSEFNSGFSELYKRISATDVDLILRYSPSWKISEKTEKADILNMLKEKRTADLMYGTSTSGPHRDRIGFYTGKSDFAVIASTGQIRLISLVLRASQASFAASVTGKKPVLLLDDVLLEMDLKKRQRFLDNLPEYNQAFFTFLPDENLVKGKNRDSFYYVTAGNIKQENLNEESI